MIIKKNNNFDLLRLLFATLVIITHAYPISGNPEIDLLYRLTDGQTHFSSLAVRGFFCISGYLIFKSLCRSQTFAIFFKKRIFRIYPALITCNTLCAIVLGYCVSKLSFPDYYLSKEPWVYIIGSTQLIFSGFGSVGIHDVYIDNPISKTINGSLWTIPYEILFYACLSIFYFINNPKKQNILLWITLCFLFALRVLAFDLFIKHMYVIPHTCYSFKNLVDMGLFFNMGALLANFNIEKLDLTKRQWTTCITLGFFALGLVFILHIYSYIQYIILPLLTISIGTRSSGLSSWYESLRLGDLSYGVYLWGFPIQQTLVSYGLRDPLQLIIFTIPIAYVMGYLSWNFVEKHTISLKKISQIKYFH